VIKFIFQDIGTIVKNINFFPGILSAQADYETSGRLPTPALHALSNLASQGNGHSEPNEVSPIVNKSRSFTGSEKPPPAALKFEKD